MRMPNALIAAARLPMPVELGAQVALARAGRGKGLARGSRSGLAVAL